MSSLRLSSIFVTLLTLPLVIRAMPMSLPVLRELPHVSTDVAADAVVTVCRINGVNILDPMLVLDQLNHGDESALETLGVDIRDYDLVASLRNLLQQCAGDSFEAVLSPLFSTTTQRAAPINNPAAGSVDDLVIFNPERDGNTPQGDSADADTGARNDDSDESEDVDSDESDDVPAETEYDPDTAKDDSGEDGSAKSDGSDHADNANDDDAQDDDLADDASRMSNSDKSDDSDETSKDSDPTSSTDNQSPSIDNSGSEDSSASEDTSSNTDEQRTGALEDEGCSFQGTESSQSEDRICVDSQVEM